ncbi:MAG: sigma-70 family RNA polymerase sigma factor [Deltaproteobacteria bacterium]|nr:sigma-70 family RNA polymerase sigma factor [Deltaproteobacteria bacterium]
MGTQPLDDADLALVRRAQRSAAAKEELLDRLIPKVHQTIYWLVGGDAEAPDLINTCLTEILVALRAYRGEGSVEAWAQRISYRVAMRHLKHRRTRERTFALVDGPEAAGSSNPEREAQQKHLRERLQHHLQRLSAERRITLTLRVVNGHSVPEVAEITGVALNTARDRIQTGLRQLRQFLGNDPQLRGMLSEVSV